MSVDRPETRDGGYDDFLDAVEEGRGFYLECENGHGWLPPRRICPECGSIDLAERPLQEHGAVETYSVVHVAAPSFTEDTPYTLAIARFGPVRLTGQVRGMEPSDLSIGATVEPYVEKTQTSGDRLLVFRRR